MKRALHAVTLTMLLLMAACMATTREGVVEEPKEQKCLETADCPSGFRCEPKRHICIPAY